jgi:hypothetical protein
MTFRWVNLVKKIHSQGIKGVFSAILARIYTKAYIYKINLSSQISFHNPNLKLEPMTEYLLELIHINYHSELSEFKHNILKKRLANGFTDKPYVIVDNQGQIYGYYHVAFAECLETCTNYQVIDEPNNIYLFDDYTFEKWRGLGAHKVSIAARLQLAFEQGYTTGTVIILADNSCSAKSFRNLGFYKTKQITFYHMGLFRKTIVKDVK